MEPAEIWKSLSPFGYSLYEVANLGKVRNIKTSYIFKGSLSKGKYCRAQLVMDKGGIYHTVIHILVALAFIPNPENKPTVDHIDGNRSNNVVTNLRWATYKEQSDNR